MWHRRGVNQAPHLVHTIAALRKLTRGWRAKGDTLGLVPTMGALHAGHMSLVDIARQQARRCVVTIFVNPTQFAPAEDLSKYPRTLAADIEKVRSAGADAVFAPAADEMYPPGFCSSISLAGPAGSGLEDAFRPTHFSGVATVVAKLLIQSAPEFAVFGEKDFQQLCVVRQMVRDLDLPVDIIGAPTLRESDGLAMSSRNVFLTPADRQAAPALQQALQAAARIILAGGVMDAALRQARTSIEAAGFKLDYLELRDAATLAPVMSAPANPCRLLAAARIGAVRLIDNIAVSPGGGTT